MSNQSDRVMKLEIGNSPPARFIVAFQQYDNENLFMLQHTGEVVTEAELAGVDRGGENVVLFKVIYDKDATKKNECKF